MTEKSSDTFISGYFQEKEILRALEEDLGFDFSTSEAIPSRDQDDLNFYVECAAQEIVRVYGQSQGNISPEQQEWLLDLASAPIFLTQEDLDKVYAFNEALKDRDPESCRQKISQLRQSSSFPDSKAAAAMWKPIEHEDAPRLIFFNHTSLPEDSALQPRFYWETATEELLHALDRSMGIADTYPPEWQDKWEVNRSQLHEAGAKTYAHAVLPAHIQEAHEITEGDAIAGWHQFETKYGADNLKRFFFQGERTVDYEALLEDAKALWGDRKF